MKMTEIKKLLNVFAGDKKRRVTIANKFKKSLSITYDEDKGTIKKIITKDKEQLVKDWPVALDWAKANARSVAAKKVVVNLTGGEAVIVNPDKKKTKDLSIVGDSKGSSKKKPAKEVAVAKINMKLYGALSPADKKLNLKRFINAGLKTKSLAKIMEKHLAGFNITIEDDTDGSFVGTDLNISKALKKLAVEYFAVAPKNKQSQAAYKALGLIVTPKKNAPKTEDEVPEKPRATKSTKSTEKVQADTVEEKENQAKKPEKSSSEQEEESSGETFKTYAEHIISGKRLDIEVDKNFKDIIISAKEKFTDERELDLIDSSAQALIPTYSELSHLIRAIALNKYPCNKNKLAEVWRKILADQNYEFVSFTELDKDLYKLFMDKEQFESNALIRFFLYTFGEVQDWSDKFMRNFGYLYIHLFICIDLTKYQKVKIKTNKDTIIKYSLDLSSIAFVFDGNNYNISTRSESFEAIKKYVSKNEHEALRKELKNMYYIEEQIKKFINKDVRIVNKQVICNGVTFRGNTASRYIEYVRRKENDKIRNFEKFLINLAENKEQRARDEFYNFIMVNKLSITNHGTVLLYKWVRTDYKDTHSGTMDNTPGRIVWMNYDRVTKDKNKTCAAGLHLCSWKYGSFGSKLLICEVHPRDVVSIPTDYSGSKLRCCEYRSIIDVTEFVDAMHKHGDFLAQYKIMHHNSEILEDLIMRAYPTVVRVNSTHGRNASKGGLSASESTMIADAKLKDINRSISLEKKENNVDSEAEAKSLKRKIEKNYKDFDEKVKNINYLKPAKKDDELFKLIKAEANGYLFGNVPYNQLKYLNNLDYTLTVIKFADNIGLDDVLIGFTIMGAEPELSFDYGDTYETLNALVTLFAKQKESDAKAIWYNIMFKIKTKANEDDNLSLNDKQSEYKQSKLLTDKEPGAVDMKAKKKGFFGSGFFESLTKFFG